MSLAPVGIFDSGVGGLSVAVQIARQLPEERLIYYADSRRAPWGTRSGSEIRHLAEQVASFLVGQGAKLVVVACNTASVHGLKHLRSVFAEVPFVGMVPAVKPAALATRTRRIGVLATNATASGQALADLVSEFVVPHHVDVEVKVPAGLVELVERGEVCGEATDEVLRPCLGPLLEKGVDTLVLGCTHFPFVAQSIERLTKGRMQLIEAGPAVARQCRRVLEERGLLCAKKEEQGLKTMTFYTSGEAARVERTIEALLGLRVAVVERDVVSY